MEAIEFIFMLWKPNKPFHHWSLISLKTSYSLFHLSSFPSNSLPKILHWYPLKVFEDFFLLWIFLQPYFQIHHCWLLKLQSRRYIQVTISWKQDTILFMRFHWSKALTPLPFIFYINHLILLWRIRVLRFS